MMRGHVFVVRADLTRLACDVVMPSCDAALNITDVWEPLLPRGLPRGDAATWLRLPAEHHRGRLVRLPRTAGAPWVVPVVAVGDRRGDSAETVVAAVVDGVRQLTPELTAGNGRAAPLIGLHLAGSGDGGLGGRRGELIKGLLPALRSAAAESAVDLALALRDPRDLAAAQVLRTPDHWPELPERLSAVADDLGRRAAAGELSLFIGAGVSRPVGLPDWTGLLEALAVEARVGLTECGSTEPDQASFLARRLGNDRFHQVIRDQLTTDRHALGHALLANLGVRQAVTTNFDRCFEHALETVHEPRGYRVLTRSLPEGGKPWLLKLHGDIKKSGSLVFTREDFDSHEKDHKAVRGVVQTLMLTSHLLFVGFSMHDENFLQMAESVTKVRLEAEDERKDAAGTVLALNDLPVRHALKDDVDFHAMLKDAPTDEAARVLEMFLDRLAWRAATSHHLSASYLLDERFRSALSENDADLSAALRRFMREVPASATESKAWGRVEQLLSDLGSDSAAAAPSLPPDLHDLCTSLRDWLVSTDDTTISGGPSADRRFRRVTVNGVACWLAGDTTRAGIEEFLERVEAGESLAVVPDSHGRLVKVVTGDPPRRIRGFYLYTDEPARLH